VSLAPSRIRSQALIGPEKAKKLMVGLRFLAVILMVSAVLPQDTGQLEVQALQARARETLEAGKYSEAIPLYEQLIKLLPDVPGLKMNLGMAYYLAGRYRESIPPLESAVKAGQPELLPASIFLGSSYVITGQSRKAIPILKEYVERKPADSRGREALADAFSSLGRRAEAAEQYRKLAELRPDSTKAWYELGKAYEALAAQAFERLQRIAPDSAYVLALIADSRVVTRQYRSAFFFYRKALEKNPRLRGIHVALSRVYRATGHADWATAEEQKEIQLGLPDCQTEKLVCSYLQGQMLEVAQTGQSLKTAEGYYWASQAFNQLAVEALSRLAALPESVELHRLRAEVHDNQGEHLEAAREWRKVVEMSGGSPAAQRNLALSLFLAKDHQAAKVLVDRFLKQEPQSSQWNYLAGEIFLAREQAREALPFLQRAVKNEPDFLPAQASLARAYMALERPADAIPHLERAIANDSDGSLHYQLGRAYQRTGNLERARTALQKYQEIQRKNREETARLEQEAEIRAPE